MHLSRRAPQSIVFSAQDDRNFGAYHDLYASGTTVSRIEGSFSARLAAYRFPDLLLFDRSVAGASHHRDVSRVRRDSFEHINLQVLRSGRMAAGSPGEERWMQAGDIVLFDTAHPQRTFVEQADYVSVAITRSEIVKSLPTIEDFHGTILHPSVAGLLSDFILTLARHAPTIGGDVSGSAAILASKMLADIVRQTAPASTRRDETEELDLHRWRAEAFIKVNVTNPLLSPDLIASGIGISRSALFRAFAPFNGVSRRILALRLAWLRRSLLRPGETRSISDLVHASGFVEVSSGYRAFKAAFGITPGHLRAEAREGRQPHPSRDAHQGWADWWGDIA